jgi:acetyltransferase-like isoleucine patch superfamily enzyme
MNNKDKVQALEHIRNLWRANYAIAYPNEDRVEIGDFTYGYPIIRTWNENTKLKIGKFCSIGMDVKIYLGGNHHNDWCTTYPFNVLLKEQYPGIDGGVAATKGDVIIGNDVWIADNVTIMSGVRIGDGATIANGSVVTKNVFPNTMVCGNPAKEKTVFYHKIPISALHWWDWPLEKIVSAIPILCSEYTEALRRFDILWEEKDE